MTSAERERYSRQILFAGLGEAGQAQLLRSHAAIVGCGALGSFQVAALARAGVRRLTIIDRDYVEAGNLQRQWLFEESDVAEALPKAVAAERRVARINSGVRVRGIVADVTHANIAELLDYDEAIQVILDGTDNFETRYLLNDCAVQADIPWIYGAAVGSYGLKLAIVPGRTACFRCVYPDPPQGAQPTCETAGVLGTVTATIAALQVSDALKILSKSSDQLKARLTTVDVWSGEIRQLDPPARDPACPCCFGHDFVHLNGARRAPISLCGRNAVQIHERARPVDLRDLALRLGTIALVRSNEFALRVTLDPYELTVFQDGRAIVKGTTDIGIARSLYARYVGV